jgi:hypothetical protein
VSYNKELGDSYAAYNKPVAVSDWLAHHQDAEEEWLLLLDADMQLLRPFTPDEFKLTKGWAMAANYDYMRVRAGSCEELLFVYGRVSNPGFAGAGVASCADLTTPKRTCACMHAYECPVVQEFLHGSILYQSTQRFQRNDTQALPREMLRHA